MKPDKSIKSIFANSYVDKLIEYTNIMPVLGWTAGKKFSPENSFYTNRKFFNNKGQPVTLGLDCDFRLEADEAVFIGSIFVRGGTYGNPREVDFKKLAHIMFKSGVDLHMPTAKDSKRYNGRYKNRLVWKMKYNCTWHEIVEMVNKVKCAVNAHLTEIAELV